MTNWQVPWIKITKKKLVKFKELIKDKDKNIDLTGQEDLTLILDVRNFIKKGTSISIMGKMIPPATVRLIQGKI